MNNIFYRPGAKTQRKNNNYISEKLWRLSIFAAIVLNVLPVLAQNIKNNPNSNHGNKFEQLGTILPDANEYRSASGAPGHKYWQQKADYDIDVTLDEKNLTIIGSEWITYYNNSPDKLTYLWLQLDENQHDPNNEANYFDEEKFTPPFTDRDAKGVMTKEILQGLGEKIISVTDELGVKLKYTINLTMMRVDLPKTLMPGGKIKFKVKWNYKMSNRMETGGRGGYEYFPEDGNHLFTITQWYPRMCVYSDYQGWQNKQFTGRGEFALAFGNFMVKMTVPADHKVCGTGNCLNYAQVLSPAQLARWQKAQTATDVTEVVTLDEAKAAEKNKVTTTKTWIFKADSVRDFAWGSSRKFVWDAMPQKIATKTVMCMSFYGKEAYPLYRKFSTKAVAHTIKTYSKFTIDYPYPVAQSIEAANGMEYPMICFNYGRAEKDGTYSEATKYGMLGVIIHEVGHNFFPMIINSDERQWSWMDEGLNTFVQFLTEQEFDNNYPSQRGPAHKIVDYMRMPKNQLEPIMTNSENIIHFGPNAYSKPATALNILRETIMGRELFDFSLKEYAKRWAFKHPTPSDFFRTMEDASAVDLDWYWRGWFYDIEPVDISLDSVKSFTFVNGKQVPVKNDTIMPNKRPKEFQHISKIRNKEEGIKFLVDADTSLRDFYYFYKPDEATQKERKPINRYEGLEVMSDSAYDLIKNKFYYEIYFTNKGGLVAPIIIQWNFKDGTSEVERINAYIWRKNENNIVKTFAKDKEVLSIQIDPYKETADIDEKNNTWNIKEAPSKFEVFKAKTQGRGASNRDNPMQKLKK
ncbi:MAG TPA: M1 family metallopeptidase [Bacteroidia bacterium]|nr:M1 family metallopeptidase [Bacteroidia bacterium]